jgi:hypothetical protein
MPEESEVECCEHQDNANIHYQPFPESLSEEREIYTHYNGCHRQHVNHGSYLSAHFSKTSTLAWIHQAPDAHLDEKETRLASPLVVGITDPHPSIRGIQ